LGSVKTFQIHTPIHNSFKSKGLQCGNWGGKNIFFNFSGNLLALIYHKVHNYISVGFVFLGRNYEVEYGTVLSGFQIGLLGGYMRLWTQNAWLSKSPLAKE
jgi:hypothetical protein